MDTLEQENTIKPKKPSVKRPKKTGQLIPDSNFAQQSRVWHKQFSEDMSGFTALDPALNASFATNWLAAIVELESFETDEVMVDYLTEKTALLEQATATVLEKVVELEFYVKKAFPGNDRILFEFGFADVQYAKTVSKQILAVFVMETMITDYSAVLLAAGMPAGFQADFNTVIGNMADAEIIQERQKRLRIRATTQRARIYNKVESFWKRVNDAAAVRYYKDELQLKFWQKGK